MPSTTREHPADSRPRSPKDPLTDVGLLLLAIIWGVNFTVIKVALVELHPFAFNALRFPLASLVLYALLRSRGVLTLPAREDRLRIVALGLLGNLVYQFLFIVGMSLTTAGNASLLLATTPVWILILSVALGHERPSASAWLGILSTVLGMGLVVLGGAGVAFGGPNIRGDLLIVGSAVAWSVYTVGSRRLVHRYGSLAVTGWTLWVGTACLTLWGLPWVWTTPFGRISVGTWWSVFYAGVFAISIAYTLWYRGVRRLGNARTAGYANVVPVVALVVAWLWLGEVPSRSQLLGAAIILVGLSLTRFARIRTGPRVIGSPAKPV